jgi:hypothetical protein
MKKKGFKRERARAWVRVERKRRKGCVPSSGVSVWWWRRRWRWRFRISGWGRWWGRRIVTDNAIQSIRIWIWKWRQNEWKNEIAKCVRPFFVLCCVVCVCVFVFVDEQNCSEGNKTKGTKNRKLSRIKTRFFILLNPLTKERDPQKDSLYNKSYWIDRNCSFQREKLHYKQPIYGCFEAMRLLLDVRLFSSRTKQLLLLMMLFFFWGVFSFVRVIQSKYKIWRIVIDDWRREWMFCFIYIIREVFSVCLKRCYSLWVVWICNEYIIQKMDVNRIYLEMGKFS